MTTPEILRELRKKKGATQGEIAKLLGFSTTAYQNYERGINEPSNKSLCILADFYGVTTDYLLGREPMPNPFADLNLSKEDEQKFLKQYLDLPEMFRAMLLDFIRQVGEKLNEPETKQSSIVAVETVGEFRKRQQEQEEEAEQKGTA